MNRAAFTSPFSGSRIPRASGDEPDTWLVFIEFKRYSPRERG